MRPAASARSAAHSAALISALSFAPIAGSAVALNAQQTIPPDTASTVFDGDTLPAFGAVGGVAVDALGYVYVADFRNTVWRYIPGKTLEKFADGLYGASGIAVGPDGDIYQSSYFGHHVSRISRDGRVERYATSGLSGPVGIAVGAGGELYVTNCNDGSIARVAPDRSVTTFAKGALFACPNGITMDDRGELFVVSISNTQIVRITSDGTASVFADIPGAGGNAHIAFASGGFYVTKYRGHQVYRVERDGSARVVAGSGTQGNSDGPALQAQLSQPNGIAVSADGREIWINELVSGGALTGSDSRAVIRRIRVVRLQDVLEASAPGAASVTAVYRAYRSQRPTEQTAADAIRVAYAFLSGTRPADAIALLRLNAADYPRDATSQFHYGEGLRFSGQAGAAIAQYEATLRLDPSHALAGSRLQALRAPPD